MDRTRTVLPALSTISTRRLSSYVSEIRFLLRSWIAVSRYFFPASSPAENMCQTPSSASTAKPQVSRRSTQPQGPRVSPPTGITGKSTAIPCSFHTVIRRRKTSTSQPKVCAQPGPSPMSRVDALELYMRLSESGNGPGSARSTMG